MALCGYLKYLCRVAWSIRTASFAGNALRIARGHNHGMEFGGRWGLEIGNAAQVRKSGSYSRTSHGERSVGSMGKIWRTHFQKFERLAQWNVGAHSEYHHF
jgi:hypothetical protein